MIILKKDVILGAHVETCRSTSILEMDQRLLPLLLVVPMKRAMDSRCCQLCSSSIFLLHASSCFLIYIQFEDSLERWEQIIGAHTDSPVLKVKPASKKTAQGFVC
jgi:hypothetical protein